MKGKSSESSSNLRDLDWQLGNGRANKEKCSAGHGTSKEGRADGEHESHIAALAVITSNGGVQDPKRKQQVKKPKLSES